MTRCNSCNSALRHEMVGLLMLIVVGMSHVCNAFVLQHRQYITMPTKLYSSSIGKVNLDTLSDIGYSVTVDKPIGIIFGENRIPFLGVCIDNVESNSNGDIVGLKVGDQLMAINQQPVIGYTLDRTISMIQKANSPVELQFYRGTIKSLYTIVINRRSDDTSASDTDDVDDEEEYDESDVTEQDMTFDENYESPVIMSADEFGDDTISVSQVAGDVTKTITNAFSPSSIGGFFGKMFTQETIQLEDKDGK